MKLHQENRSTARGLSDAIIHARDKTKPASRGERRGTTEEEKADREKKPRGRASTIYQLLRTKPVSNPSFVHSLLAAKLPPYRAARPLLKFRGSRYFFSSSSSYKRLPACALLSLLLQLQVVRRGVHPPPPPPQQQHIRPTYSRYN